MTCGVRRTVLAGPCTMLVLAIGVGLVAAGGCGSSGSAPSAPVPRNLSEYGLFTGNGATQEPAPGVIPYDLNSPLFSDYADKYRFVRLPPGTSAEYRADDTFVFPVGTIIAKTFAFPTDDRDPALGRRLIETRILKRDPEGWVGLPYIWNADQTEAVLDVAGDMVDVAWIDDHGEHRTNNYIIPNANQCKGCHQQGDEILPIGPKARHLNRDFAYAHGSENQLAYWTRNKALVGAPILTTRRDWPYGTIHRVARSTSGPARGWRSIAHCHNPVGPARNSGLDLMASQTSPTQFGIFKTPVAAGRGSGGLLYDIVPGNPAESIITFRMASIDGGIMMPELGKRLVHEEGLAPVRDWIAAMPPGNPLPRAQ